MKRSLAAVLLLALFAAIVESKTIKYAIVGSKGGKTMKVVLTSDANAEVDAPEKQDIFEINKGQSFIDGDIIPPKQRNTLVSKARHWDTKSIPVSYASGLSLEAIGSIEYARIEYELRTCLSLVDRTSESNYITFDTLSGCYSSVGEVGGGQTISIGNGCERIGTVVHEIMHAIGIYHEQSRTDRDDYVTIALDNVDSGKEHNFNTYSYATVDERRVPYDYNSVMHYSDTSFSNNGLPTIVTKDPTYQDVIGQRRAFSPGDVAKINRMYECADTKRISSSCTFEEATVCGYYQEESDSADWSRHVTTEASHPDFDSTSGKTGGSYMLFDTTQSGVTGAMYSMRMKSNSPSQCLEFSYHLTSTTTSGTRLRVYVAQIDSVTGEITAKGNPVTTISGVYPYEWNIERQTISAGSTYKLIFEADKDQATDVIAIDDVSVVDKPCETGYFVLRQFSSLIATADRGMYIFSPTMYTDDGYAFKVKVYPVGTTSSSTGYMSMYFAVTEGDNDDQLQWPFADRFIRMSVVDQDPEVVARMSQSNNLMSDSTGSAWQKPTSGSNSAYGYSSFMPLSDITDTRNFLKHDTVVISVEVKDMRAYSKGVNKMQVMVEPPSASNQNETVLEQEESGYSFPTAIAIIGLSSAGVFLLMIIFIFIVNERNSKQLNKAMLNSTN